MIHKQKKIMLRERADKKGEKYEKRMRIFLKLGIGDKKGVIEQKIL